MKWFWGSLLIIIGLIFLGINTNYLSPSQIADIARFWPLLLVIWGVSLVFARTKYGWIITFLVFFASLSFICMATFGQINYKFNKLVTTTQTHTFSRSDTTVKKAKITINTGAIELNLKTDPNTLIKGGLTSNYLEPELKIDKTSNDQANISLNTTTKWNKWSNWPSGKNTLDVKIAEKIPVDLTVNAGASQINLDLSKAIIEKITLNAGATEINVKLGNTIQNNAKIQISTGASNIKFTIPKDIGVRFKNDSPVTGMQLNNYKNIGNKIYESPDYSSKSKKIEINSSSGASSVEIKTK